MCVIIGIENTSRLVLVFDGKTSSRTLHLMAKTSHEAKAWYTALSSHRRSLLSDLAKYAVRIEDLESVHLQWKENQERTSEEDDVDEQENIMDTSMSFSRSVSMSNTTFNHSSNQNNNHHSHQNGSHSYSGGPQVKTTSQNAHPSKGDTDSAYKVMGRNGSGKSQSMIGKDHTSNYIDPRSYKSTPRTSNKSSQSHQSNDSKASVSAQSLTWSQHQNPHNDSNDQNQNHQNHDSNHQTNPISRSHNNSNNSRSFVKPVKSNISTHTNTACNTPSDSYRSLNFSLHNSHSHSDAEVDDGDGDTTSVVDLTDFDVSMVQHNSANMSTANPFSHRSSPLQYPSSPLPFSTPPPRYKNNTTTSNWKDSTVSNGPDGNNNVSNGDNNNYHNDRISQQTNDDILDIDDSINLSFDIRKTPRNSSGNVNSGPNNSTNNDNTNNSSNHSNNNRGDLFNDEEYSFSSFTPRNSLVNRKRMSRGSTNSNQDSDAFAEPLSKSSLPPAAPSYSYSSATPSSASSRSNVRSKSRSRSRSKSPSKRKYSAGSHTSVSSSSTTLAPPTPRSNNSIGKGSTLAMTPKRTATKTLNLKHKYDHGTRRKSSADFNTNSNAVIKTSVNAAGTISASVPTVSNAYAESLLEKINSLEQECRSYQSQKNQLKRKLQHYQENEVKLGQVEEKLIGLQLEKAKLESARGEFESQKRRLERSKVKMEVQLTELENKRKEEVDELNQSLADARETIKGRELEEYKEKQKESKQLNRARVAYNKVLTRLQLKTKEMNKVRKEQQELEQQIDVLNTKVSSLGQTNDAKQQSLFKCRKKMEVLRNRVQDLEAKQDHRSEQHDISKAALELKSREIGMLSTRLHECETQIKHQQLMLSQQRQNSHDASASVSPDAKDASTPLSSSSLSKHTGIPALVVNGMSSVDESERLRRLVTRKETEITLLQKRVRTLMIGISSSSVDGASGTGRIDHAGGASSVDSAQASGDVLASKKDDPIKLATLKKAYSNLKRHYLEVKKKMVTLHSQAKNDRVKLKDYEKKLKRRALKLKEAERECSERDKELERQCKSLNDKIIEYNKRAQELNDRNDRFEKRKRAWRLSASGSSASAANLSSSSSASAPVKKEAKERGEEGEEGAREGPGVSDAQTGKDSSAGLTACSDIHTNFKTKSDADKKENAGQKPGTLRRDEKDPKIQKKEEKSVSKLKSEAELIAEIDALGEPADWKRKIADNEVNASADGKTNDARSGADIELKDRNFKGVENSQRAKKVSKEKEEALTSFEFTLDDIDYSDGDGQDGNDEHNNNGTSGDVHRPPNDSEIIDVQHFQIKI